MSIASVSLDDLKLLTEMDSSIRQSGPSQAFALLMQKQALEDRISFKNWLAQTRTLNAESEQMVSGPAEQVAAAVRLSHRAQLRINSI